MDQALPPCRHRGEQIAPGSFVCTSPQLVLTAGGVPASFCRHKCPYVNHNGQAAAASASCPSRPGLRLVRPAEAVIGHGFHRSGWPYAYEHLLSLTSEAGILFDDFVEQRFCYRQQAPPYGEPWIGVFHHPPKIPPMVNPRLRLDVMMETPSWRISQHHLLGGITLSQYLADYLSDCLDIPIHVVKHPSESPEQGWCPERFFHNPTRTVAQIGWFLRNTQAIYQVPQVPGYRRLRVLPHFPSTLQYDRQVQLHWGHRGDRPLHGGVEEQAFLDEDDYDNLLASAVILNEMFEASANNVVVECIARGTPLIVNRHPAVVEYVGENYPLLFDDIREVPSLLADDRILEGHRYLIGQDRRWLRGTVFRETLASAVERIAGSGQSNGKDPNPQDTESSGTEQANNERANNELNKVPRQKLSFQSPLAVHSERIVNLHHSRQAVLSKKSTGYKRFVVFTLGRTGSTLLMEWLGAHPAAVALGEPFNLNFDAFRPVLPSREEALRYWLGGGRLVSRPPELCGAQHASCEQILRYYIWHDGYRGQAQAVGFKLLASQIRSDGAFPDLRRALEAVLPQSCVVLLTRHNLLRRCLSERVANQIRQWHVWDESRRLPRPRICLESTELRAAFEHAERSQQMLAELASLSQSHCQLSYEELVNNPGEIWTKVQRFLELPEVPLPQVKLQPTETRLLQDAIENYHQLKSEFVGSPWQRHFDE